MGEEWVGGYILLWEEEVEEKEHEEQLEVGKKRLTRSYCRDKLFQ